jgi:S-adenosylmethionine hydrolase
MQANGVITFTTDFGTRDPYVGIMKGIVLTINPKADQIDITHDIPPHDIVNASFIMANVYHYFPLGTVHVAVVDPGVGGGRKNIAVLTEHYFFIGPDNGIFTLVFSKEKILEIREIKNIPFIMKKISNTFHGRDVFAPCAGHLSAGKSFSDLGPVIDTIKNIKYPEIQKSKNTLIGEVVSIDSFGNMITNISERDLKTFIGKRKFEIYFASERFNKIAYHYSEIPLGKPLILFGSTGNLEISMNGGSASSYFMTSLGTKITVQLLSGNHIRSSSQRNFRKKTS